VLLETPTNIQVWILANYGNKKYILACLRYNLGPSDGHAAYACKIFNKIIKTKFTLNTLFKGKGFGITGKLVHGVSKYKVYGFPKSALSTLGALITGDIFLRP